ncbi:MAG: TerB family tellurite resistance protein [Sulfuritalea sp.]|nr:TerB family tellurite resistance protein [Sulfuritalea sp.]MBK8118082.1 TerB family tellurite resistance protein [Sulfuritalea sp.]
MIADIRNFFMQLIEPAAGTSAVAPEHALQLATAALLVEMMRMDGSVTADETATVTRALQTRFDLGPEEVGALMTLATAEARQATDYFQFTSLINKSFSAEQKIQVIESLWQAAFADGRLDAHEQHFMSKISDLLYVPHSAYIAAKQRARAKG